MMPSSVNSSQQEQTSIASELRQQFGGLDKSVSGIDNTTLLVIVGVVAVAAVLVSRMTK